jgi:hypothetical protein
MPNRLKAITTRAKIIRRSQGGSWKAALKKAGAEFRAKGSTKKRSGTRKRSTRKKVGIVWPAGVGGNVTKSRSHTDKNRITNNFQIGTVAGHLSQAKKMIADKIADKERQKFITPLKRNKRKIQKEISELKKQYRKL